MAAAAWACQHAAARPLASKRSVCGGGRGVGSVPRPRGQGRPLPPRAAGRGDSRTSSSSSGGGGSDAAGHLKPAAALSQAAAAAGASALRVHDFLPGLERPAGAAPHTALAGLRVPAEHDVPLHADLGGDAAAAPYVACGPGRLDLIMGPMFAGKSSALIAQVEDALARGAPVAIVKSAKDQRYSSHWVVAHSGRCVRCHTASSLSQWRADRPRAYAAAKVVAVDEAQFFEDLVEFAVQACDVDGKVVVVAGLSGDFRRAPFGQLVQLVPLASSVTLLKAACASCGRDAEFSLRLVCSQDQELVGGADKYRAACRDCYVRHHHQQELRAQHPQQQTVRGGGAPPPGPRTPLVPPLLPPPQRHRPGHSGPQE